LQERFGIQIVSQHLKLPSLSTIRKFVAGAVGRVDTGFTSVMFRLLSLRVSSLDKADRHCVVVIDEMSLRSQLTYDKNLDRIIGYTDEGLIATHALVFMVRGLRAKWKQSIGFFFTHNTIATSTLSRLITECIQKLCSIGLFVRCMVCDQGATNMAAVRDLGCTADKPNFVVSGSDHVVHVIYDVPHLLKSLRNNFLKYDIKFENNFVGSWKHIVQFYELDRANPIRLAPRLTDRHVEVNNQTKMRVCLAAQVFSHSVAAGLQTRVLTKELPAAAVQTASFLEKIDTLFDVLNSRKWRCDKPARCALTADSINLKYLLSCKEFVSTWCFIGARSQTAIKCHAGLLISLQSIYSLSCELLTDNGFAFVCTSRLNQDCLENFFAGLRGKQGWNENPTPAQFQTAFRSSVILSSLDSSTSGINDDDFALLNHAHFSATHQQENFQKQYDDDVIDTHAHDQIIEETDNDMWCEMTNEILNSDICFEHGVIDTFTEAEV